MALRQAPFNPALQNNPLNWYNTSAPGTPYADQFPNTITKLMIAPDIDPNAVPSYPAMFKDMAWLMSRTRRGVDSLQYHRYEKPWVNVPLVVRAGAAGAAASPGAQVTATIQLADNSYNYVTIGEKLNYGGVNVIVTNKSAFSAGASTLTVGSMTGELIPATTTGQELMNHGPWGADGFSTIYGTGMSEFILYDNVLEYGRAYATRFDRYQQKTIQRMSKIDFVKTSMQDAYMKALTTMQARAFMGTYGQVILPDGSSVATGTSGILEQQDDAGVTEQVVGTNQAIDALREIVFDTALQSGGRKVLLGTRRSLQAMGWANKGDKVRYAPASTSWDGNLYSYDFAGHECVWVPMDQWMDRGLYTRDMSNTILVLNEEDVIVNYFNGDPIMSRKHTLLNQDDDPGSLNNFNFGWYEFMFGVEVRRAWATGRLRLA
jgi:hypothetical protein